MEAAAVCGLPLPSITLADNTEMFKPSKLQQLLPQTLMFK